MDRREMLKGAAAAVPLVFGVPAATAEMVNTDYRGMSTHLTGYDPNARWPGDPVPYDPVAVLEAMRERFFVQIECEPTRFARSK